MAEIPCVQEFTRISSVDGSFALLSMICLLIRGLPVQSPAECFPSIPASEGFALFDLEQSRADFYNGESYQVLVWIVSAACSLLSGMAHSATVHVKQLHPFGAAMR
jgi:membrane-associated PAP2 superfamily phosphatase